MIYRNTCLGNRQNSILLTHITDEVPPVWPLLLGIVIGWSGIIAWNVYWPSYVSACSLMGSFMGSVFGIILGGVGMLYKRVFD